MDGDGAGPQGAGDAAASSGGGATDSPQQPGTRARYRIYLRGREARPVEFDASQVT